MKKFFFISFVVVLTGCCCNKQQNVSTQISQIPGPQVIVYKTTNDYFNNVPVGLDNDGTIVSYPAPSDLTIGGSFAYPTRLDNGYLLDNRGIGPNVAFLKMTYEEYSALSKTPSLDELYNMILDANPLKEMYKCGNKSQFKNVEEEINKVIHSGHNKCGTKKALKKTFVKIY